MNAKFFLIFIFFSTQSFALFLLDSDADVSFALKKQAYQEVLLVEDYPMCLMKQRLPPSTKEMNEKLLKIHPNLKALWVPTSLFQLFVLHSFFTNEEFRSYVQCLGHQCNLNNKMGCKENWGEVSIDDAVVSILSNPKKKLQDIFAFYDEINRREKVTAFFLKMNDAFCKLYSPKTLEYLLAHIPLKEEEWQKCGFPFLFSPYGKECFSFVKRLFSDHKEIIRKVIAEEYRAHEEGKHLIYRGGEVIFLKTEEKELPLLFLPVKGKKTEQGFSLEEKSLSFSLSYANTLLGGIFLCTDACAARYALEGKEESYSFHALKLDENALIKDPLFCIPFLHPFAEMLVDGEWFHPHARIAKNAGMEKYFGWYAKINLMFDDYAHFIVRDDLSAEKLGIKLLQLAKDHAIVIHSKCNGFTLREENHEFAIQALLKQMHQCQPAEKHP